MRSVLLRAVQHRSQPCQQCRQDEMGWDGRYVCDSVAAVHNLNHESQDISIVANHLIVALLPYRRCRIAASDSAIGHGWSGQVAFDSYVCIYSKRFSSIPSSIAIDEDIYLGQPHQPCMEICTYVCMYVCMYVCTCICI